MAEYFFRTDGTAATLGAATGPASSASDCGDQALLEASTFTAGDIVNIVTNGGSFNTISLDGSRISGSSGNPVIVRGDSTYNTATTNTYILRLNGATTDVEYVTVENFWAENTLAGSDVTDGLINFLGAVGDASNTSINITGCKARSLRGDGFSQVSGASNSGHINYTNCDTVDCGSSSTGSHQGWTAHQVAQTATLTNCTSTDDREAISFVGGSTATWESGTITDSLSVCVKADSAATVNIESGVTVNCGGGGDLLDCSTNSFINFNGATVNITSTDTSFVRSGATLTINGGNWLVNAALQARIECLGGGTVLATGNTVFDARAYTRFFTTNGVGTSTVTIERCTIDLTNCATTIPFVRESNNSTITIDGNIFLETDGISAGDIIDIDGGTGANVNIRHNTVYNASLGGNFVDDNSSAGITLTSNIFYNVNLVCQGSLFTADYNCYFNSSDEGGANSITSDPEFTSPGSDFTLQATSPALSAGEAGPTVTTDYAGNSYTATPSMGALQYFAPAAGGTTVSAVIKNIAVQKGS